MYLVGIFKRSSSSTLDYKRALVGCFAVLSLSFLVRLNAQSTASKQITKFSIDAPQLDTIKQIWVYLPKSYQSSGKRYPVIYMHDAQNLFDASTSYVGEWGIDEYLDTTTAPESIIVGIEHGNDKRINELTPFKNETYGGGMGENYVDFIVATLKPYVDTNYKTLSDAKHTGIFGSSLGGLISYYAILKYPRTFGWAGIFSPAFWINPEIFELTKNSDIPDTSRFFILTGGDEGETMVTKHKEIVELLKSKGIKDYNLFSTIIEGGVHNESFWGSRFGQAYLWANPN